ncbi:sugar phosphate isomerase/epimerase [Cyclobacterium sp. 1_MG-2023]|uniref:sugar phosphate isomerase/epimerase family protein n=1 Tax=Cyclobacterium sp. 1_MG-2023 TaxID=3062681 RepID=UPI0026E318E8|nr:sugar phosphate isomerase/epimerase [Cyclobacterium sp. 1_MG-2023]MDO6439232.1 sugar phosphate isomerase/epimerase [Cyclobacterium sp. 1_MG-2023]
MLKKYWVFIALPVLLLVLASMVKRPTHELSVSKSDWNIGVALYSFNRFPFPATLEKAKVTGVKYVEGFDFHKLGGDFGDKTMSDLSPSDAKAVRKLLKTNGLKMKSMYVGKANDRESWQKAFELAKSLKIEYLVAEPKRAHWDMVDQLAGEYKIKIALHQHSREAGSIYWHPDSVLSAIKNHPNFGACGDLGHWTRSGLNPIESLKKLEGHLISLHLKDLDASKQSAKDVKVGEGVIDFEAVVHELKRQKFDGEVYAECEHKMEDNLEDVIHAVKYFGNLTF